MTNKFELYQFKLGEILYLRKVHPCGNSIWKIERVGQEIGIRCIKCKHFLLITRRALEKAVKEVKNPENQETDQKEKNRNSD